MSSVKVEKFIQAPPSEVFTYLTNSTALRDWMSDIATTDPRPGGHFYLCWAADYYTSGEFVEVEKNKHVSFTWHGRGEPRPTLVDVLLKKKKGGTLLKLSHRGMGKGEKWDEITKTFEKEWKNSLDNLVSVLEQGPDLRITRRPMMGIFPGEFNPDLAKKLGVPVDYGMRLDGVVDGMGAQKGGLLADDVIVSFDGHELTAPNIFGQIIRTKHAGDCIDVIYYRGSEKRSIQMTLSGREIPPIPASPAALRDQVAPVYQQYEAEIENLLQSATEAECKTKPKPDEWSVNEVLAHLIHSEIGWQNVVSEIIGGHEGAYDDFGGNIQAHIDGTVSVYQTKEALFNQLKTHDAETLNTLAHIPLEFLSRKGKFWKLVFQAGQNPYHLKSHLEQMQAALEAARHK